MGAKSVKLTSAKEGRPPSFLWQGLLIVLPVLVLAAMGCLSLRQDRILAQHEATERAQTLADELAQSLWEGLRSPTDLPAFKIDRSGQLQFPVPFSPVPKPHPLDTGELSPPQQQFWEIAQEKQRELDWVQTTENLNRFIESSPPEHFAAIARYNLGLLYTQSSNQAAAVKTFTGLLQSNPGAIGESGLPLGPLAQLKLVELETGPKLSTGKAHFSVVLLCSNAVYNPSAVTPSILKRAAQLCDGSVFSETVEDWQKQWEAQQLARKLYAAAQAHFHIEEVLNPKAAADGSQMPGVHRLFWIKLGQTDWLASRRDEADGFWVSCAQSAILRERLLPSNTSIRDYFAVSFLIAGKPLAPSNDVAQLATRANSADSESPILATAAKVENGIEYLRCSVRLQDPHLLFARQRQRTILFGSLILVSFIAALVGFFAARTAFRRQLGLAEMKTNFVSSVSHELRAPIASVRLMAEGLERGTTKEPEKQKEYFRFIVQECRRLSSMIENVLDFSRIEQGRKQYEFESTDLCALVEQTVKLMSNQASERGIQLEKIVLGEPKPAEADGRAIQQALVNLIDNAMKHSPNNSVVTIGLEFPESPKPEKAAEGNASGDCATRNASTQTSCFTFRLWVEDQGEGIPAEEHGRIFERFYRCGSELRRETPGVGIGLSIVKHIVEAHRGQILVCSAPGEGSRFTIELRSPCPAS